jgi:malonate-semialdehyde dehydrogenase (acetylating) / methylmalonate-semialdehyde dehydrogenase
MTTLFNFIDGSNANPSSISTLEVTNPASGEIIAHVPLSTSSDVNAAVAAGKNAFANWSNLTIKQRAAIMFKFHHLVEVHSEELAQLIVKENGKNIVEALADVAKGINHPCLYENIV